ncbi:hypothetical protein ACFL03_01815 [Thermodesulfobacteriota bacterium]
MNSGFLFNDEDTQKVKIPVRSVCERETLMMR